MRVAGDLAECAAGLAAGVAQPEDQGRDPMECRSRSARYLKRASASASASAIRTLHACNRQTADRHVVALVAGTTLWALDVRMRAADEQHHAQRTHRPNTAKNHPGAHVLSSPKPRGLL